MPKKPPSIQTKEEVWRWLAAQYSDPKQFDQHAKWARNIIHAIHGRIIRRPGRPDDLGPQCFEAIEKGLAERGAFKKVIDQSDPYSLGMVPVRKVTVGSKSKRKTWVIVAPPHEQVPLCVLIDMIQQRIPTISPGTARKWAKVWELNNVPNAEAMTLTDRVTVAKMYKERVSKM